MDMLQLERPVAEEDLVEEQPKIDGHSEERVFRVAPDQLPFWVQPFQDKKVLHALLHSFGQGKTHQPSISGGLAQSAQSQPGPANSGQLEPTSGQQLDPSNLPKSLPQLQPQQQMPMDSFMDLGTSIVSEQVSSTQSSSNQLVLQAVNTVVQNLTSLQKAIAFQINQQQCQYLCHKLAKSVEDADVQGLIQQGGNQSSTENMLKRLLQAAKDVEILVKDCCSNELIQAAIILADSREHFASLAFKVEMCMALLQNSLNEETKQMFLSKLEDWSNEVSIRELKIIDDRASKDKLHLLTTLRAQVGSSNQMENLIQRLEDHGPGGQNAARVKDMWKEDQSNLQRLEEIAKQDSTTVYKIKWHGKLFAEKCFFMEENETFKAEASILEGLVHPNIMPTFCCTTSDRSCSIVMELMDQDLSNLMQEKPPFELLEAVEIMLQIAEDMRYLHQNRVIHRDLKSMNILVKGDKHVHAKGADFGLSKFKESSSTYSIQTYDQGTTRWMAPELFGNLKDPNHGESDKSLQYHFKVDVYSFGMVCYEILSGRVPFDDIESMTKVRKMVKDGLWPVIPDQYPKRLSTLIQHCWRGTPAERPSFLNICGELRHIICSLMLGSAV